MDIHKPKPWHGLREFLKEYLIIVVGVLTALALEAGVEWLHWRHQVELVHEALAFDMKRVMAWAGATDAQSPCVEARLEEIDAILDAAQTSGRLPEIGVVRGPGQGGWVMRSWPTLTYGQTLAHLSHREQLSLSALALQVDSLHQWTQRLPEHWDVLRTMTGRGRPTDGQEITRLRLAVIESRRLAQLARTGAVRTETFVIQSGLLPRADWERAWKEGVDTSMKATGSARVCEPLARVYSGRADRTSELLGAPMIHPGEAHMDDMGIRSESLK